MKKKPQKKMKMKVKTNYPLIMKKEAKLTEIRKMMMMQQMNNLKLSINITPPTEI